MVRRLLRQHSSVLTVSEVAKRLRVSQQTVRNMVEEGVLQPFARIDGGPLRIPAEQLDAEWMEWETAARIHGWTKASVLGAIELDAEGTVSRICPDTGQCEINVQQVKSILEV
jgi:excisionase family DNA binding protein